MLAIVRSPARAREQAEQGEQAGQRGQGGLGDKIVAALAAIFAIALGHLLVILLVPQAATPPEAQPWARLVLSTDRFGSMLPLLCALAIAGSASRFILARSE